MTPKKTGKDFNHIEYDEWTSGNARSERRVNSGPWLGAGAAMRVRLRVLWRTGGRGCTCHVGLESNKRPSDRCTQRSMGGRNYFIRRTVALLPYALDYKVP